MTLCRICSKWQTRKKLAFTPAIELSYIKPKNQKYIAVAIEGQQSSPSLSQAQRTRELDQNNLLQPDMIDSIRQTFCSPACAAVARRKRQRGYMRKNRRLALAFRG